MTWSNGRQLDEVEVGGKEYTYTYDANGQRMSKTWMNEYTEKYVYYGTQLSTIIRSSANGSISLTFIYDDNGQALGFYYDTNLNDSNPGTKYYYVCNAQGDVLQLRDHTNAPVANYYYDTWGKLLGITDANGNAITASNHVAVFNPIRYRGYFYDTETGFYYLNSRYYDPEIGRFINADSVVIGATGAIKGYNLFEYCFNNPVNMADDNGNWPKWIKKTVKWVAKNIVKPIVNKARKILSKINATYTKGTSTNFSSGIWNFSIQGGISVDTKGNVAIQGTFSGGATSNSTPTASIGNFSMVSNAPSVNELNGDGYQLGGSASVPLLPVPVSINVGRDLNIIPNIKQNSNYYGLSSFVGISPPTLSVEGHAEWGKTGSTIIQFNVFDVMQKIYIKIMEW